MSRESKYVAVLPMFLAVLIMLGMVIAGAMMAATSEPSLRLARQLIIGGVAVGLAGVLTLPFSISRRRWTLTGDGLEIRQGLAILPRGLARRVVVPFGEIASITQVFIGARETVEVTTRAGRTFRLMVASSAPIIPALLSATGQEGLREGLGFWASRTLMVLLLVATGFSLIILAVSLAALWDGSMEFSGGSAAGKGFGILLALPFGLIWAVWQVAKRRRRVLAQS